MPSARVFDAVRTLFREIVDLHAAMRGDERDVPLQHTHVGLTLQSVERAKGSPLPGDVLGTLSPADAEYYCETDEQASRVVDLLAECPSTGAAVFEAKASYRFRRGRRWVVAHGGTSKTHDHRHGEFVDFALGVTVVDDGAAFVMLPDVSDVRHVLMVSQTQFDSVEWIRVVGRML